MKLDTPFDGFDDYCEDVSLCFNHDFFEANEDWILENNGTCDKWLFKLYNEETEAEQAARIIERAFKFIEL